MGGEVIASAGTSKVAATTRSSSCFSTRSRFIARIGASPQKTRCFLSPLACSAADLMRGHDGEMASPSDQVLSCMSANASMLRFHERTCSRIVREARNWVHCLLPREIPATFLPSRKKNNVP
jgi:hypothetical protein